jgi:2-hydroxycyclohexanecarboxyl-CoA dehydrogenase
MTNSSESPNKVAIVTGGASGIGRATCLRLARDSIAIAVWDLDSKGAEETARMIGDAGGRAIASNVNAASIDSITAGLQRTRSEFGPVTILVNNAAITGRIRFLEITADLWERMLKVNLTGPYLCIKAVLPDMLAAGWGRIVNISSSSAQWGGSLQAHYVASKAGLAGLTKALAMEFADQGITVNVIPPGYIDTPMARRVAGDNFERSAVASPMKRAGKPEELAAACAFLASDEASYITGQTISVNGGRYLV